MKRTVSDNSLVQCPLDTWVCFVFTKQDVQGTLHVELRDERPCGLCLKRWRLPPSWCCHYAASTAAAAAVHRSLLLLQLLVVARCALYRHCW